jgi:ABC-type proline/glycine betaine transport system permease subunit
MNNLEFWERVASIGGAFGLGGLVLPGLGEWTVTAAWLLVGAAVVAKIALYVKARRISQADRVEP